jgi:carbonic anhydrase
VSRFHARAVLCVCLVLSIGLSLRAQEARPRSAAALQRLKDGNARFAADRPATKDVGSKRRDELTRGQQPFAAVLSCADSRVVPELLFDQGLGDLFVLRVAGNIAGPGMVGSLEYAVEHLHVPLIVVLGHEECGAVKAALDGKPLPGQLGWLVKQVQTGENLPANKKEALAAAIKANVLRQTADLTEKNAELKELVAHERVKIVPGIYSLATGKVTWVDLPER